MSLSRYQDPLQQKVLPDGRTVYMTVKPTAIQPSQTDIIITVTDNSRMDIMANNVYGSPIDWWRIASVNENVNGSLFIEPGTQITISTQ